MEISAHDTGKERVPITFRTIVHVYDPDETPPLRETGN
ncbi:hypothetical protein ASZ90_016868 [hydrocarbon metagenome]|uniref:Uncharacterized protein n=1 Tax=hydrocarbon metagenome TaxID=938273 RepID=A0A0W8EB31_9ZZZZ